jgi:hypothetical protein
LGNLRPWQRADVFPELSKIRRAHDRGKKFPQSLLEINPFRAGERDMRIGNALLSASVSPAVLTAPALAKHSDAQKADDKSASAPSACHAYERAADGSSIPIPCGEIGASGQAQPKSASHETGHQTR